MTSPHVTYRFNKCASGVSHFFPERFVFVLLPIESQIVKPFFPSPLKLLPVQTR
jgi:hypothetical protein